MYKKFSTGQSLVEFALILPIMLLLILGALEFGRLFYIKVALQNAAREGAYQLSYSPSDLVSMQNAVLEEGDSMGISINRDSDILVTDCCTRFEPVEVTVKQDDVPLLIFGFFIGDVDLSSSARMMVQ